MIDNTGPAFWSSVAKGFDLTNYAAAGTTGYTFGDNYNASYISAVGSGSSDNIRTAQGRNDKRYAEITFNSGSMPNGSVRVGIFQTSGNLAPPIGNSIPSAGYGSRISGAGPTAFVTVNGSVIIPSAVVYSVGNTVMVAFDGSTGNMWFGLDGSWLTGNPATGSSPTATIATGTYFVAVCADESGSGNGSFNVTGRFQTGATIYAIPSGFSGVDD